MFSNPDSTDPFWHANLRHYICADCSMSGECLREENMPVISPLARWIMRWHNEQKTVPGYPFPGNWEDQPGWFSDLMAICSNTFNRLEREAMEAKK